MGCSSPTSDCAQLMADLTSTQKLVCRGKRAFPRELVIVVSQCAKPSESRYAGLRVLVVMIWFSHFHKLISRGPGFDPQRGQASFFSLSSPFNATEKRLDVPPIIRFCFL